MGQDIQSSQTASDSDADSTGFAPENLRFERMLLTKICLNHRLIRLVNGSTNIADSLWTEHNGYNVHGLRCSSNSRPE